ncbi:hypothetical protein N8350_03730 [Candidatus Nanopelagicales bacterium]|nr:hypothetical protein [Candidatus Nanopelagicales bacterium]
MLTIARKEDLHLIRWLLRYTKANPTQWGNVVSLMAHQALKLAKRKAIRDPAPEEDRRARGIAP